MRFATEEKVQKIVRIIESEEKSLNYFLVEKHNILPWNDMRYFHVLQIYPQLVYDIYHNSLFHY